MFNHAIRYYQLPVNPARITRLFVREGFYDYQEENDGNGGSELMHSSVTTILDPVQLTDLLHFCEVPRSRAEIQERCGYKAATFFRNKVLNPLLESGLLEMTRPDSPNHPNQKYVRRRRG